MTELGADIPYALEIRRAANVDDVREVLCLPMISALPAGSHFHVSAATKLPFLPTLLFVRDQFFGRSPALIPSASPRTIEAVAYDLVDFFNFLDACETRWQEVEEQHLHRYVDSMVEHPSPTTGGAYAAETIRRRLSSVRKFLAWAGARGMLRSPKASGAIVSPSRSTLNRMGGALPLAKTGRQSPSNVPPALPSDDQVRIMDLKELRAMFEAAGPLMRGKSAAAGFGSWRNRLMLECGLQAGLRREEIVRLRVSEIASIRIDGHSPYALRAVRVLGKGAKWRKVNFPIWLLEELQSYAASTRTRMPNAQRDSHDFLFVNERLGSSLLGSPLCPKFLNRVFARVQIDLGITRSALRRAEDGSTSTTAIAKYGVHSLRHHFALTTYFTRKREGDAEPWLYIQAMLGHEFLATTTKIYLRAARALESEFSDQLTELLRQMGEAHA